MKHTPLPWAVARPEDVKNEHWYAGRTIYSVKGYGKITDTSPFTLSDRANARFIVEACNNHYDLLAQRDRLVEALREMVNLIERDAEANQANHAVIVLC